MKFIQLARLSACVFLIICFSFSSTVAQTVTTLAGSTAGYADGTGTSAMFNRPWDVAVDGAGNVYVADQVNHLIRKITSSGVVSTFAGSSRGYVDGTGTSARFSDPIGVDVDGAGNVYVADHSNSRIRKITSSGVVSTFAGSGSGYADGTGTSARFLSPYSVAVDGAGNVYVADAANQRIRKITSSGVVTTLAGSSTSGTADGTGTSAKFHHPTGVAVDGAGNVYVADQGSSRIRKITSSGVVTTLAGSTAGYADGTGTSAKFNSPYDVAVDGEGSVYVGDISNSRIRKISSSGVVSTLAGSTGGYLDGIGTSARFNIPVGVGLDGAGNVYVADYGNHRIRKITTTVCSTTRETIVISAYNTYTTPSGNHVFTESGTYMDTINNANGCDSVLTINLTVNRRLFVDAGMGSSGTGGTWGTSFKTLKEALDSINKLGSIDDDERIQIWVKSGTYYAGGSQSSTDRNSTYEVTNLYLELYGGFSGVETSLDQRNTAANPSILCGDLGKTGDASDNAFHVMVIVDKRTSFTEESYNQFIIDGIIFKDGNAGGNTKYTYSGKSVYQTEGGAIAIIGSGVTNQHISPTISNCHFENNYSDYGAIFIQAKNAKAEPTITNCTFKGNTGIYGTIFNDGQGGEVSPYITNCAFDSNSTSTSGAAIYNYGYAGKTNPRITNCVFNNNHANSQGGAIYNSGYGGTCNPIILNCTFYGNSAGSHAGAMYSFGASGTCQPKVTNSILYKNTIGTDADHKFSEFYNYSAYPYVKYSSLQRASSTYTSSTANSLNGGTNNVFQTNPNFEAMADGNGVDNVWRTGDDGLRLSSSSSLINAGVASEPFDDILGSTQLSTRDMGAYEYVNCGLNVKLATSVKTHTASQSVVDDGFVCYCNSDNELLLAIDTNGTGAVITPSQVKLYIGNPSTLSYNSAGGMITNTAGGVILERRWDVDPTTQPTSPVTVRYFYTNDDYSDIVTAMAGLTAPTTISSPSQLQFYKVTGGSTATFPNPHDTGVTGIVLTNGTTASTTVWVNGTHGVQDHTAEYLVSTFSGGGGGGGGGSEPLPVELIQFEASVSASHTADLTWKTASELNNSHFVVERSYDGRDFEEAGLVQGNGTTQNVMTYDHNDNTIALSQNSVYYRLRQVDFDGTEAYSPIRRVDFDSDIIPSKVSLYPNPTKGTVTVSFSDDEAENHAVKVIDNLGRVLYQNSFEGQAIELDLSSQATGIYFIILDSGESFKVVKE